MKQSVPKKYGKKTAEWRKVRASWVANNPPTHEGQYVCGLCGRAVSIGDMELDHINPRSGNPESFADSTNLQPTHFSCNRIKGSRRVQSKITPSEYEVRKKLGL